MTAGLSIDEARPGEYARLAEIERQASSVFVTAGMPEIVAGGEAVTGFYEAFEATGLALVARSDNRPVGFALVAPLGDEAHLWELDVLPAFQRRGIGTALLAAAEDGARRRGHTVLSLSTFQSIPWNAPFYARHGYAIVPRSDYPPAFYLLDKVERLEGLGDRCIMVKALT